jgi:hypothetical protein
MLTPSEVLPFLTHDRSFVREHALRYFTESGDTAPLTAEHLWEAIDRLEPLEALPFVRALTEVPQTEDSFQRLFRALVARPRNLFEYHVQKAAGALDFALLSAHRAEVLRDERLTPDTREHLEARLELAATPPHVLWDRLMQHGDDVAWKYAGEFDIGISERLVEALARNSSSSNAEWIERALAALRDPDVTDSWNEIFLVQFLGRVRCTAAVDLFIDQLLRDEADVLNEKAYQALARIGTLEVIDKVEAAYAGKSWSVRLFAREPLHRIKRAESEGALVRLLASEADEELLAILAHDLFDMGSMQALQRARELMARNRKNVESHGLCTAALAVAIMTGAEVPEAANWESRVERDQAKLRALRREMDDGFGSEEALPPRFQELMAPADDWDGRGGVDINPLDAIGDGPALIGAETYRRDGRKVGRNDPCPCGSGKKFKKCCGG